MPRIAVSENGSRRSVVGFALAQEIGSTARLGGGDQGSKIADCGSGRLITAKFAKDAKI